MIVFQIFAQASELVAPNGAERIPGYTTSWIGNTYGGMKNGKGQWVQQDIAAMCVTPDGTVYTNIPWEEAGGNCCMYRDGQMLGSAEHTHGWGFNGGKAVAVNDRYVYIALSGNNEGGGLVDPETWPPKGKRWFGVSRRLRSDFTKGAPFDHGKGGKGDTLPKCFLVVNEVPDDKNADDQAAITGLWADDERLYVSNPLTNCVEIYDAETMLPLDAWEFSQWGYHAPGQIAADHHGSLWVSHLEWQTHTSVPHVSSSPPVVQNFETPRITQFSQSGEKLAGKVFSPGAFCFGPKEPDGPDEVMFVFQPRLGIVIIPLNFSGNPAGDAGLGERHKTGTDRLLLGMTNPMTVMSPFFYPPGEFGDLRFDRYGVTALGCDGHGRLYIAQDTATSGGGAILECHSILSTSKTGDHPQWQEGDGFLRFAETRVLWRLFGLCFIDCATLDPDDETVAYTKDEKYKLDWSQGPGREWSLLGTVSPDKTAPQQTFLNDSAGVWVRNIGGKKFLFLLDMNNRWLRMQSLDFGDNAEQLDYARRREHREVANKPASRSVFLGKVNTDPAVDREILDFAMYDLRDGQNEQEEIERILSHHRDRETAPAQGWWVDLDGGIWRATETTGIQYFPCVLRERQAGATVYHTYYHERKEFPHAKEFDQVKRIRYDAATDTLYLGGCATVDGISHRNQHWKPMGPVICRYDNFLYGENPGTTEGKLRWKIVAPYVTGSSGHESCEPMGFDIAGDYMFVPYTGASKTSGFKTGHVGVFRLDDGSSVGWMEPDPATVGEIGLQDIRECLSAHKRANGEYVVFLEDDYKAKVVMFRWKP